MIGELNPDPQHQFRGNPIKLTTSASAIRALRAKNDGQGVKSPLGLESMPNINALSYTVRYLPGGRRRFLEFVKLAAMNGDVAADAWWKVYADLSPYHRARCSFDDVCVAAGVKPSALMAGVVGHGMEAATDMGNLVAAALHPDVIAKAGASALRIDGPHAELAQVDRIHLLQARGFLPIPKGAQTHVHVSANAQAAAAASDPSVPNFSNDIAFLEQPKRDVQKRLAEGNPEFGSIEVDAVPEPTET